MEAEQYSLSEAINKQATSEDKIIAAVTVIM
jgi:hypothetical protein